MKAEQLLHTPTTLLLDGAMGTMLQAAGLPLGARPEALNLEDPALIESIHAQYAAAGSRILCANTFGASAHKLAGSGYTVEQVVAAGIGCAKRAAAPYGALVALDVGPLGELLEPAGALPFEEAVAAFARIVRAGAAAGADLVLCETFTDLYELKAALLACKENCALPVLASMSFEAGGRTFTGCTAAMQPFAALFRSLGSSDYMKFVLRDSADYAFARERVLEARELRDGRPCPVLAFSPMLPTAADGLPPDALVAQLLADRLFEVQVNIQMHKYVWPDAKTEV